MLLSIKVVTQSMPEGLLSVELDCITIGYTVNPNKIWEMLTAHSEIHYFQHTLYCY